MPDELLDQAESHVVSGLSAGIMPDEEGRLVDDSRSLGIPADVLKLAPKSELRAMLERPYRLKALARSEKLAKWTAANPLYAALSHDDAPQLANLGEAYEAMGQRFKGLPTTGEKWKATALAPLQGLASGIGGLSQMIYGGASAVAEVIDEDSATARYLRERAQIGGELPVALRRDLGGQSDEEARTNAERLSRLNALYVTVLGRRVGTEEISGGAVSLAPALVAGAASGGSLWAVLGAAALQSAGSSYAELRDEGAGVGEAGAKALLAGTITAGLMRAIPNADKVLTTMIGRAANPKLAARAAFSRSLGATAAGELTEEGLDQFLNSLLVMGKPVSEAIADGVQAGLIGGVIGGAVGVADARQARQMAMAQAAQEIHATESDLVSQIDASKTAERSKAVIQSYLQSVNPDLAKEQAYFDPEVLTKALQKPEAEKALASIGVTREAVAAAEKAGHTVAVSRLRLLTELPADVREELRPFARTSPEAMHKAEADEVDQAKGAKTAEDGEAKAAAKALRGEEQRLVKELMDAGRIDEKTARTQLKPLLTGAKALFSRNPAAAKAPVDALRKVTFRRGETAGQDVIGQARQKLTDLEGKTANARTSLATNLPPGVAARVDALTGQREMDPAQVGEELIQKIRSSVPELQLAGQMVTVTDEAGAAAEVDAAVAVGMLRERLEAARRLKLCLEAA